MTRQWWVVVHRYVGLYLAFFLIIAGTTGSLLAFFNELNGWLQADFTYVESKSRKMLDPFELRERALLLAPGTAVNSVDLIGDPARSYVAWVQHQSKPSTGEMPYSVIILDPYSGEELTRRVQGQAWPVTIETAMEFVYALHYRLLMNEVGIWMFGIAALIWAFDCFVGFYLTLPRVHMHALPFDQVSNSARHRSWWQSWKIAWRVRRGASLT